MTDAWDPLHVPGSPDSHWSTDNVGEALPGVATPLGWSVWDIAGEQMCRDLSHALGVFSEAERQGPAPGEDRIIQPFYGRIAMRMEWLGTLGDRMPGMTGPDGVRSLLGRVPDTMGFAPTRRRYPVIAARMPRAALTMPGKVRRFAPVVDAWWRAEVDRLDDASEAGARGTLGAGLKRFSEAMTLHGIALFATVNPLVEAVGKLIERTGVGDVGTLSGTGGAEMVMVGDLWRASRGELTIDAVVRRHGYHGPLEGEISSRVWREDPGPLTKIVAGYAQRSDDDSPLRREERARARLPVMQAQLLAALPAVQRPAARLLLRHTARTVPLRGVGKASFLQALDVARAAARRLGDHLAAAGSLSDRDDVFLLTVPELLRPLPADVKDLIARRRERRAEYEALRLPASWRGVPEPTAAGPPSQDRPDVISGIAAGGGTVEGLARVVTTPDFDEVEPGEILVARTTDPSWASIMFVSAALVVDIGSPMSHAAVVARELEIPCVVNTRTGSDVLTTGDRIRVDGGSGTVEILERAAAAEPAR